MKTHVLWYFFVNNYCIVISLTTDSHNEYYIYLMYFKISDDTFSIRYLFFILFIFLKSGKFTDKNSVRDKKKLLSLKCVIK